MNKKRAHRILFISQYFFPESFNNNKVVERLCALGYQVHVLSAVPNYPEGRFYDGYGLLKRRNDTWGKASVRRAAVVPRGSNSVMLAFNYLSFVLSGTWEAWRLRNKEFDLVFSSAPSPLTIALPGIYFAKKKRIPHFFWVQDVWPQTPFSLLRIRNRMVRRAITAVCRYIYKNIDCLLIPSLSYEAEIESVQPSNKYHYFPNTLESYHRVEPVRRDLATKLSLAPDRLVIMYAGNIGKAQNVDAIVDAAMQIRANKVSFVILGDGRDLPSFKKRIVDSRLSDMFHFAGKVPAEVVPQYLSFADAAIVTLAPDPTFDSVLPFRVQTFLACGKPILAHARGETARVVHEAECGLVSDPEDPYSLARNIDAFAALPREERLNQGALARRYATTHFSEERVYTELEQLIETTINATLNQRSRIDSDNSQA